MTKNEFTGATNTIEAPLTEILEKHGLGSGRMVSGSKSMYGRDNPNHKVYFNACIFDKTATQVWWGDLDITESEKVLKEVAKEYGHEFYVTPEHPYRMDFNKGVTKEKLENDESVTKIWSPK